MNSLIIATEILGWKNYSSNVLNALSDSALHFDNCQTVKFDYEIYDYCKVPRILGVSDALTSAYLIKAKVEKEVTNLDDIDYFFVIGHQLTIFLYRYLKNKRFTIVLDATPKTALKGQKQFENKNFRSYLKGCLSKIIDRLLFRRVFSRASSFVAMSNYVKESLITDYGIPSSLIYVAYPPQKTALGIEESGASTSSVSKINLIFVGNDFVRKGGDFLISLFTPEVSRIASLNVISNDPAARNMDSIEGVRVLQGLNQADVLYEMRQSDVLLFPSWKDEFGLVIAEAMSQGLAIFARNCGAQGELVKTGMNGKLFGYEDTVENWREAIKVLHRERSTTLTRYKEESIRLANEKFSDNMFNCAIKTAFDTAMRNRY